MTKQKRNTSAKKSNGRNDIVAANPAHEIEAVKELLEAAAGASRLKEAELKLELYRVGRAAQALEHLAETCKRVPSDVLRVYSRLPKMHMLREVHRRMASPTRYTDAIDLISRATELVDQDLTVGDLDWDTIDAIKG